MFSRLTWFLRRYSVLLVLLALVAGFAWLFRHTLLPFLVAIFIVYLMEPIVLRLHRMQVKGRALPRIGAVVIVYTSVIGAIALFAAFFVPRLAAELRTFADDAPGLVQQIREERLPQLNAMASRVVNLLGGVDDDPEAAIEVAREATDEAVSHAVSSAMAWSLLPEPERGAAIGFAPSQQTPAATGSDTPAEETQAAFQIRARPDGAGFDIVVLEGGLEIEHSGEGRWRILPPTQGQPAEEVEAFDLERALTESMEMSTEGGSEGVSWAIEFFQTLIEGILETITTLFITLMVAAFISSDVPRFIAFFYTLIPPEHRVRAQRLLFTLNEGLAGVIRGQVFICIVNGVLTGVGLALLGVKFAVLLAFIAGVLSLIPIFGTILSTIPAVLVGLTQSVWTAVLVVAWILVIHFIEANILNPKILGDSAKIHPVVVVFALLAGEHSFGLIGALLAVPTASIVQSLFLFLMEVMQEEPAPTHEPPVPEGPL